MTPEEPQMTPARTDAIRDLLAERVRDEPELRRRRLRRRLLVWGGVGVFAIGGLSTAGSILFGSAPVTDKALVYCLSSVEPQADGSYLSSAATMADPDGPGRVDDALELCGEMWRHGLLDGSTDPTAATYSPDEFEVPELQVCVRRDGAAAVVPSDDDAICQTLGMATEER